MRRICGACGRPDQFQYRVPDEIWERVVPRTLKNRTVCLVCFDDFAAMRRINYATRLKMSLRFAGDAAILDFEVRRAVPSVFSIS